MIAAFYEICLLNPERIVLYTARVEHFDSIDGALRRMDDLVREATRSYPRRLVTTRRSLDTVHAGKSGTLARVLQAWANATARWTAELFEELRARTLLDNALLARRPNRSERLVIEHWGAKRDLFGSEWVRTAPHRDIEEQPNAGLARWCAGLIRSSLSHGEARLDCVEVEIQTEDGKLKGKRYDRLLLPFSGRDGEKFGLVVNVPYQAAKRK
jgi:hypothetical protein